MNLTMGLRKAVAHGGDAEALVCGDVRLDYRSFVDRVARLGAALSDLGMGEGDRVAMLAANGQHYIEFYFGVLWGGGVIVPINSRFALPEMIEQIRDAGPVVLIVDGNFAEIGAQLAAAAPSVKAVLRAGPGPIFANAHDYDAVLGATPPGADALRGGEDLACIFYTGGTTGRSKGVMLSHRNVWANAAVTAGRLGFDETMVSLHAGPLFHLGAGARVFTTALLGGKHVVIPRFTPIDVLDAIARDKITVATFVPTMLAMMLELPDLDSYDLSSLRMITYGASPMPEAVLTECMRRFPSVRFAQSYGMTELSPVASILGPEDHLPEAPSRRLRSAGRPLWSAEIKIVDAMDLELPTGEVGEVAVRGPMVMQGYWNRPELTAEALRGGWMHTGDSGYFEPDGYLYIADRIKDMIISGGENVYSTEVENAVSVHPDVLQCAVIGIPDPRWGEAVHAVVVRRAGAALTAEDVIAQCRGLIAGYKCPRSVEIRDEALPLSSVNKINKAALRAPFWDGKARQVN
ncbi:MULTISPECIES: long-chain-fatty-acid--CoA ligase [Rhodopseudomonas]|uniref:Fatty-acid--CoA ligase n=1 Tax=Rhodopseudomonas palustris TaxID=1076 RepID=A0A0D7F050_RHOPL|nr:MULTISPECIES: long-chain-fatty-acid--CoA ligase [Rhodopseudomonas]KIZ46473.1 fatty-acid--CoA ligase [Rhodopseudomonas palustris]MDF3810917.1 long-chain-fatty-acid--CoA ligase [Rhodopseudomonas sp. BAL398]WOK19882.1 long-chain-fatty-acid--CoA ligase [Rhodopseudomonas sp. BAL398]